MSNSKTNQFGGALLFILGEFAVAEDEMIEDGGMEVFGEDDQGREGSCEVSINELAQAASDEIKYLTAQQAKANEIISECWNLVGNDVDSKSTLPEHVNALNERVKGLELTVKGFKEFIAVARVMFLDLDEMEVNSKEYTDLLSDLFTLFCGGDEFHKYVNKFAIGKKIEALESFALPYKQGVTKEYVKGGYGSLVLKAVQAEIEQLHKEQS